MLFPRRTSLEGGLWVGFRGGFWGGQEYEGFSFGWREGRSRLEKFAERKEEVRSVVLNGGGILNLARRRRRSWAFFFFRGALTLVWGLGVVITVGGLMNHNPEETRVESVDGEARA